MERKTSWIIFGLLLFLTNVTFARDNTTTYSDEGGGPRDHSTCSQESCGDERTFGVGAIRARRMAMFFLPVMFKLGVIMTLLVGLTVMVFKGLSIGLVLLFFAISNHQKQWSGGHGHDKRRSEEVPVQVHIHQPPAPYHMPHNSYVYSQPNDYGHGHHWMKASSAAPQNVYLTEPQHTAYDYKRRSENVYVYPSYTGTLS